MTISTTNITKSYNGNGSTHSFAYDFKIFADADLTVIVRSAAGTETTKTLNTHYVVTGAGSASGGNVLFKYNTGTSSDAHYSLTDQRPASGETVVIRSELNNTQTLDLVANDPFPASSFEDALDRLVRMVQQHDEELDRSIKLSRTNTMTSTEFATSATDRASKILAFDSSGELSVTTELGTFKGNWAASTTYALRDIVKDTSTNNIFIATTAHTSSGAQPLTTNTDSAKWSLLVDAASATASQTAAATSASTASDHRADAAKYAVTAHNSTFSLSSTNSGTSGLYSALHYATEAASSASTATSQASAATTAKTAAETALDSFDDRFLGAKGSDPSADNDGNALLTSALYWNNSDGLKVYNGSAWELVKPSSSEQANINTLAGISSDVTTLSNALSSTTTYAVTVASVGGSNVFVLDGSNNPAIQLDRGNTYIFDQSNASNAGHTLAFKNGSSSYTTGVTTTGTAGQAGAKTTIIVDAGAPSSGLLYYCVAHGNAMGNSITTVTSNFAVVASNIGNINTVAGNNTNINNVAGISSAISAVNSNSTNINAVNSNSANITTVAGSNSNITSVAGSIANVNTVASNLTNVNSFADTYFISSTAPSSPTTGDLWFDTSSDTMKVYGGSGFQNAGSSVNGTSQRVSYTATAGQTSFAATYDAGYVDVYLNGIKLISGTDFTATNGTSIVLSSGAALNDTVDIVAYGTFVLSNFSVGDANDVSVSGASSGDVLTYNGSAFAPAAPSVPTLSSLGIANHDNLTVDGSGNVALGTSSVSFGTSAWSIVLDGTDLDFQYNGTTVFKLASSGAVTSADNITAFGTP